MLFGVIAFLGRYKLASALVWVVCALGDQSKVVPWQEGDMGRTALHGSRLSLAG
jgi:hypothetical protein